MNIFQWLKNWRRNSDPMVEVKPRCEHIFDDFGSCLNCRAQRKPGERIELSSDPVIRQKQLDWLQVAPLLIGKRLER